MTKEALKTLWTDGRYIPASSILALPGAPDPGGLFDTVIPGALAEFSADSPRTITHETVVWSGTPLELDGWIPGTSVIASVESPLGNRPRTYIGASSYDVDDITGALDLYGLDAGASICVRYTGTHAIPATGETTLSEAEAAAFLYLVTAHIAQRISVSHGDTQRTDLAAESVNQQTKSGEYKRIADACYATYRRMMGLPEKRTTPAPAGVVVAMDGDADRIFGAEALWP